MFVLSTVRPVGWIRMYVLFTFKVIGLFPFLILFLIKVENKVKRLIDQAVFQVWAER